MSDDDDRRWPHEPPEFDPTDRWGDPERDLASVPEVHNPADDLPDPSEVDPSVSRPFWIAVVYANVALFGVSLGLMLIGFRGQWRWGGAAIVVGLLCAVRVYQTYRAFRNRDRGDAADAPNGDSAE